MKLRLFGQVEVTPDFCAHSHCCIPAALLLVTAGGASSENKKKMWGKKALK
jgi:hypothetical protein